MLISCPVCPKTYQVDEAQIPDDGRDVSCAACGTVWFEPGRSWAEEAEAERQTWLGVDLIEAERVARAVYGEPAPQEIEWHPVVAAQVPALPSPVTASPVTASPVAASPVTAALTKAEDERPRAETFAVPTVRTRLRDRFKRQRRQVDAGHQAARRYRARVRWQAKNRLTVPRAIGWAGLAASCALLVGAVVERDHLTAIVPGAAALYQAAEGQTAPIQLTDTATRYAFGSHGAVFEVSGIVENRGASAHIPAVAITFEGAHGALLEMARLTDAPLAPGARETFMVRAIVPDGTIAVRLAGQALPDVPAEDAQPLRPDEPTPLPLSVAEPVDLAQSDLSGFGISELLLAVQP